MKTDDKCPYCNRPNVIPRRRLKDLFCGWCKRFFVFETGLPKYLGRRTFLYGKWQDSFEKERA